MRKTIVSYPRINLAKNIVHCFVKSPSKKQNSQSNPRLQTKFIVHGITNQEKNKLNMHIGQKNYKNPNEKKNVPSFRGRELRWQRL